MASTKGTIAGGSENGYADTVQAPQSLAESLDNPVVVKRFEAVYKHIEGNWYLYYKQG
jgi:hypothetical protein